MRELSFIVSAQVPDGVSEEEACDFVLTAVSAWGGSLDPQDSIAHLSDFSVHLYNRENENVQS